MKERRKAKSKRIPYGALRGGGYEGTWDCWTYFVDKAKERRQGKKEIKEQLKEKE